VAYYEPASIFRFYNMVLNNASDNQMSVYFRHLVEKFVTVNVKSH